MTIARSLNDISRNVSRTLRPDIRRMPLPEIDTNLYAFKPWNIPSQVRMVEVDYGWMSQLAGILFCSPDGKFGKEEILPFLDYFSERTGQILTVFCAGYVSHQASDSYPEGRAIPEVDGKKWWFDVKSFNNLRLEIEERSTWTYSGETDLILLTAQRNLSSAECLSFSNSLACNLEQMVKDKAVSSPRAFVEQISRISEAYQGNDPVSHLSDQQGLKIGGNAIKEALLAFFPEKVREEYREAEHFAIRTISR